MKTIQKIKGLKKMDAAIMAVLILIALACFALTIYGVHLIVHGNLFAVIWCVLTAGGACITSEEAQKVWEAQDVKVNH